MIFVVALAWLGSIDTCLSEERKNEGWNVREKVERWKNRFEIELKTELEIDIFDIKTP